MPQYNCDVSDLFLKREEQVTGDLTPAIFVLRHEQDQEIDLDNLAEMLQGVRGIGGRGWEIKRFKGLGEMNKEELWETTMDPANRVLRKVAIGESATDPEQAGIDASEADHIFSVLMGEKRRIAPGVHRGKRHPRQKPRHLSRTIVGCCVVTF